MSAAAALLWYIVVAGPQGGVTALPSPFESHEQCLAAIKDYEATKPPANWTLQCVPAGPISNEEDVPDEGTEGAPAEQQQQ